MTGAMNDTTTPRVALVTNVLSHYRVPCFRRLAELLPGAVTFYLLAGGMEHRRYVLADGDGDLPAVTLSGRRFRRPPQDDLHWNDVGPLLRARPEVLILGGWSEPTFLHLWLRHLVRRSRVLFWIESTAADRSRRGGRELSKRILLRGAAGCVVPGRRAGEYCRRLGVPAERIFTAPNAVDRSYFRSRAEELLPRRGELRRELGVAGNATHFLFVGRLVESIKGVAALIRAVAAVAEGGTPAELTVVGDGPDAGSYRTLAGELGAPVRFLGTLDHDALCRCYAAADILVLPSRSEVWGLVLNEGMEFGLPLVVSDAVGAGPDLVHPGVNGRVVPAGDADALAEALVDLAADPEARHRMGRASRSIVEGYSPEGWAEGMLRAVRSVAPRRPATKPSEPSP